MDVGLLPFFAEDELQRAVMVFDIALARGCRYKRALGYAVESLESASGAGASIAERMIEQRWQKRSFKAV